MLCTVSVAEEVFSATGEMSKNEKHLSATIFFSEKKWREQAALNAAVVLH